MGQEETFRLLSHTCILVAAVPMGCRWGVVARDALNAAAKPRRARALDPDRFTWELIRVEVSLFFAQDRVRESP